MLVRGSELRTREVVNISDGRKLGNVVDVDIDLEAGRIRALIVPGTSKVLGFFGRNEDLVISWEKIKRIGHDVILVEHRPFTSPHIG
ncbi:MAG: YlmC/YmxH family sporulation protein [Firmicutes bacterium]|jgi:YlmC/YmxH family sporulation protein|nr:YlmC/YmxH family sporulation protein [Bacillota bacterium]